MECEGKEVLICSGHPIGRERESESQAAFPDNFAQGIPALPVYWLRNAVITHTPTLFLTHTHTYAHTIQHTHHVVYYDSELLQTFGCILPR